MWHHYSPPNKIHTHVCYKKNFCLHANKFLGQKHLFTHTDKYLLNNTLVMNEMYEKKKQ